LIPGGRPVPDPGEGFPRSPSGGNVSFDSRLKAVSEHVSCQLEGEAFILSLRNGVYYGLNTVGARIWQLVQEPRTPREIRDALISEYQVEERDCTRDVLEILERLFQWNLVELHNGKGPHHA